MHSLAAVALSILTTPLSNAFDRIFAFDATSAAGTYAGFASYGAASAARASRVALSVRDAPANPPTPRDTASLYLRHPTCQLHRLCPPTSHQLHLKLFVIIAFATVIISAINKTGGGTNYIEW
jgi:hypothetical protein